jgi:predicted exporter
MAAENPGDIDIVLKKLGDSEEMVRSAAALGLGAAGSAATPAMPFLIKLQKTDPSEMVRSSAAEALAEIRAAPIRETASRALWGVLAVVFAGAVAAWLWKRKVAQDRG